jgi:hypothetical protein
MKNLFVREIYIRLSEEGFVCTSRFGKFFKRGKQFPLHPATNESGREEDMLPAKKKTSSRGGIQSLSLDGPRLGQE